MRAVAVSDGKTIGRAQARFAPLGPRADRRRADECADAAAAALCRAGRHLVAAVGGRGVRPVGAGGDRRRHQRAAGRSADPRLAEGADGARIESAVTGMVVDRAQAPAAASAGRGWC